MAPTDETWTDELRGRLEELLDEYRAHLAGSLDGLTEDEARARLVPSRTTLLGLLKHVTYVERTWFSQAVTGATPKELGIASPPHASFGLRRDDSIATVVAAYEAAQTDSRATLAGLALDDEVDGRGPRAVWTVVLQVLRELAHHSGHADILREQVLAARDGVGDLTPSGRG